MEISSDSFLNPPSLGSQRQKNAKPMAFAENKKQQRPPQSTGKPTKNGTATKKKQSNTTYKDWQVREETVRKSRRFSASKSTAVQSASANTTQKLGGSQQLRQGSLKKQSDSKGAVRKTSKSRSKSRPRSASRGDSIDQIRQRVQLQFNNYMQDKMMAEDEDDISLLASSQTSPPREIKKQMVLESKMRRKQKVEHEKRLEMDELKRKEDNMKALELRFKSQTAMFKREVEQAQHRDKERKAASKRSIPNKKSSVDDNSNWSKKDGSALAYNTQEAESKAEKSVRQKRGKQTTELRQWIDNAMKDENLHRWDTPSLPTDREAENLEIPGVSLGGAGNKQKQKTKVKKNSKSKSFEKVGATVGTTAAAADNKKKQNATISAISNKSIGDFTSNQSGKAQMLKHQLPGNSMLTDNDARKLGYRADRYGVFSEPGTSEFDRVVSSQRSKMLNIDGSKESLKTYGSEQWHPSKEEASQVKKALDVAIRGLGSRTSDKKIAGDSSRMSQSIDEHFDEQESETDRELAQSSSFTPSRQIDAQGRGKRSPESEDSSDKIPVKLTSAPQQRFHRTIINKPSEEDFDPTPEHLVPGVLNTQAHFERLDRMKKERETSAALTIQKHYRGARGRKYFKKAKQREAERVEIEYERLNRELKSDTQYNMKSYLAQMKRIREKHGMVDSVSGADEIAEVIGESGSFGSLKNRNTGGVSTQMQNFFRTDPNKNSATEKDPHSIISIFAKRNGVLPEQSKERRLRPDKTSSKDKVRIGGRQGRKVVTSKTVSTDSIIEEDYADDFSESLPKEESIIEDEMPKTSSGSFSMKVRAQQKKSTSSTAGRTAPSSSVGGKIRSKRVEKKLSDSIAEEVLEEDSFGKNASKNDDSIAEESIANEIDSDGVADRKGSDSIIEDSIIKEEYDGDNYASYNASQSLKARNRIRFGMHSQQLNQPEEEAESKKPTTLEIQKDSDLLKLADDQAHKTLERNRMIGDMMNEMREYEKAALSETLVNRMEKIVASSMAQKDQIIMAQRLAELEAEKRHKEEINKIREEQIKLMTQLMLLGPATGGVATGAPANAEFSVKYREDLLSSITKIIEKPIQIKNETVHVNYSISKGSAPVVEDVDGLSASFSQQPAYKQPYLKEYEESQRLSRRGNVVSTSRSKIQEMVEEDISLRLGKGAIDLSMSKPKMLGESIDDLVGEVTSAIEESIRDEVVESRISTSKISRQGRDNLDYKRQTEKQKSQPSGVFLEIERAIDSERSEREERLAQDLKRRKITPAEYDRGIKEIEKWVVKEKKELLQRRRKMDENQKDMKKYVEKFQKDHQSVPMLKNLATSPRIDSGLLSYQDDSQTSEQIQNAQRQAHLLDREITGVSPEQKYSQKKREAAMQLIEQKQKAIQKTLKEKMQKYQGNQAEDLMQKALELDVGSEAEKLFQQYRREIEESKIIEESRSQDSARISQSNERLTHTGRAKKSVQFAPSISTTKPTTASTERVMNQRSRLDETDDISESIQIAESISQSLRSHSMVDQSKNSRIGLKGRHSSQHSFDNKSPRAIVPKDSDNVVNEDESIIESDYSRDSFEGSIASQDISQSANASKLKLRNKAKELEESANYSENFEEESMGKSMTLKEESATKDKLNKMATVKEESADDSQEDISVSQKDLGQSQTSKSSKTTPKVESSLGSLPSEDISVKDSVRSVDWKFDVPQDSIRESAESDEDQKSSEEKKISYIREEKIDDSDEVLEEEEDIETSSDLNTRDEMADLESCPEGVSVSDDINTKADLMTEELLELILEEYRQNENFNLNTANEQPDEEDYKDKFPWTMDKKPEPKPSPKPEGVTIGAKPRPPKTLREIKDEEFKKMHDGNMNQLKDRESKVIDFLDFMCKRVDLKELIAALNKPIQRDPMKILSQHVNCYDEEDSLEKMNDEMMLQSQILPQSFFNKTDREYIITERMKLNKEAVDDSDKLTVSQEEMENINNVHHYALFESFNEALDQFRPYQNKGQPMPWSKNTRAVKQIETEAQAKSVLAKARENVIAWMKTRAGTNYAPLPDPPPQSQDEMGEDIIPPPLEEGEEERRNLNRQEKLAELMTDDIIEHDALWIDYEIQDTQTRFDLADMILHHLAGEIAEFLAEKALSN